MLDIFFLNALGLGGKNASVGLLGDLAIGSGLGQAKSNTQTQIRLG